MVGVVWYDGEELEVDGTTHEVRADLYRQISKCDIGHKNSWNMFFKQKFAILPTLKNIGNSILMHLRYLIFNKVSE